MRAAVDNDILLKGACYGLLQEVAAVLAVKAGECGVLGAARFVVRDKIVRTKFSQDKKVILGNLNAFLSISTALEPAKEEQAIAARLESSALRLGLSLDAGESQLCAMVIERALPLFVTGDKRAITALGRLIEEDNSIAKLRGKLMCLEQLVLLLLTQNSFALVRAAICLEPEVDKALTICFSCQSAGVSEATARQGLESYVRDLRFAAALMLIV